MFVDETVGNDDDVAGGRTADGWEPEDSGVLASLGGIGTDGGGGGSSSVVAGGIAGAALTACGLEGCAADSAVRTMPDAMGTGFKFAASAVSVTIYVLAASAEPGVLAILGELRTDVGGGGAYELLREELPKTPPLPQYGAEWEQGLVYVLDGQELKG